MKAKSTGTRSAGGVVLNPRGEVLVVNQHGNSWSLPKGQIDDGEDAFHAAIREIYEESGIRDVEFMGELGQYERYKISKDGTGEDTSELKNITMFLFRTKEYDLKPLDPENPEARWLAREKVAMFLTHPKDREFFMGILEKI